MKNKISINGRSISQSDPPYVIAEMSANHNGRIEDAFRLIEIAKKSGADAVKMQTYTPDTITLNADSDEFVIHGGIWDGRTLYDLYKEAHTPWEWHSELFSYASKLEITLFSSPFDFKAVDLLEDLNCPAYKIASFEAIDLPLIRYVASTHKPMIISTGMANLEEIQEAIDAAYAGGCSELAILHCVSGYPAPPEDYNLKTIADFLKRFNVVVGLSDHTLDNITAIASIGLGCSIIEKHFTLDRSNGGPDDSFSLEPKDLKNLCVSTKVAWESMGFINHELKASEKNNIKFRRSLYFVRALKAGQILGLDDIRSVRPGYGLPPKFFDQLIGRKLACDVLANTAVAWHHFVE